MTAVVSQQVELIHNEKLEDIKKKSEESAQQNALLYAFMLILASVHITTQTAEVHSKMIEANAADQEKLIQTLSTQQYEQISDDVTKQIDEATADNNSKNAAKQWEQINTEISEVTLNNQKVAAKREVVSDEIMTDHQDAQVRETQINTDVNNNQQTTQVGSQIAQITMSLTNQIEKI